MMILQAAKCDFHGRFHAIDVALKLNRFRRALPNREMATKRMFTAAEVANIIANETVSMAALQMETLLKHLMI